MGTGTSKWKGTHTSVGKSVACAPSAACPEVTIYVFIFMPVLMSRLMIGVDVHVCVQADQGKPAVEVIINGAPKRFLPQVRD